MKKRLITLGALCAFLLLGTSLITFASVEPLFHENPTQLPDLREKYDQLCGNNTSAQTVDLADLNADGLKDIVMYTFIDGDSNLYQFAKAVSDRQFEDRTEQMLPNYLINSSENHVWTIVRDIDNNGQKDIVEGEPILPVQWPINQRNSVRWEWNGSSFTKIQ